METRQFRFVNPKSGDGVEDWVDSEFLGVFGWGEGGRATMLKMHVVGMD